MKLKFLSIFIMPVLLLFCLAWSCEKKDVDESDKTVVEQSISDKNQSILYEPKETASSLLENSTKTHFNESEKKINTSPSAEQAQILAERNKRTAPFAQAFPVVVKQSEEPLLTGQKEAQALVDSFYENSAPTDMPLAQPIKETNTISEQAAEEKIKKAESFSKKSESSSVKQKKEQVLILKNLEISPSQVLSPAFLENLRAKYEQKPLSIDNIKGIVSDINTQYQQDGYLTSRAFVPAQHINKGHLKINLFEGTIGSLKLKENGIPSAAYVKTFLDISEGSVLNIPDIEKRVLLFNAVNDTKMRIALMPAEKVGATDIEGLFDPIQTFSVSAFTDNAGQKETGYYRFGSFVNINTLLPIDILKDKLNFGGIFSKGSKALFASYAVTEPWQKTTWTIGVDWSNTDIVGGDLRGLSITGNFYNYSLGVKRPVFVRENFVTNLSLSGNIKSGATYISDFKTQDVNTDTATLSVDFIYIFTQGYLYNALSFTQAMRISDGDSHFNHYNWAGETDMVFGQGWGTHIKGNIQFSEDDFLPSSDQFQVGGVNSVRGYPEGMLVGDRGGVLMMELRKEWEKPVRHIDKATGFAFMDMGKAWSSESGTLRNENEAFIYSAGFGVKVNLFEKLTAHLTFAFPLKKHNFNKDRDALEGMRALFFVQTQIW
jgi:hemolysin activation/secretion protein